jgi:putative flippase GtrA
MNNRLKKYIYKGYKFIMVGFCSTIFNFSVFVFFYKLCVVHYIASSILGYLAGLLLGYFINKNWTFSTQVDKSKSYIRGYVVVYLTSLVASQTLLYTYVELLLINPLYANVIAIGLSTLMNFIGTNYFVFKKH